MEFNNTMLQCVIDDPKTQEIMKEAVQKSIVHAIENSFSYGDLNKAIEKKIKEILVPAIESYDISEYVPKMESILMEIINKTNLADNKRILENFKSLMIEPESNEITLETIFMKYCEYMSKNVDTTELDVNLDDGPAYESFECSCYTENSTPEYWRNEERIDVHFTSEKQVELHGEEGTNFSIVLKKWSFSKNNYDLIYLNRPNIDNLRYMNDFEIYLMRLARAGVRVTDIDDFTQDVNAEAEPEAEFH